MRTIGGAVLRVGRAARGLLPMLRDGRVIPLYQDRLRVRARASTGLRVAMTDLDDFKA
jgi:hypothetical protein